MNGAEALVRMLQLNGVKHIFGLCGDTSLPFYDALRAPRPRHGPHPHARRAQRRYMADAYARVTGKVGVCEGRAAAARRTSARRRRGERVLDRACSRITSDVSVGSRGKFPLTELDQQALYRPLTKWNTTVDRAEQIPGAVRSAFPPR
jgi:acetolactate synthase-1/2/3 large subunit